MERTQSSWPRRALERRALEDRIVRLAGVVVRGRRDRHRAGRTAARLQHGLRRVRPGAEDPRRAEFKSPASRAVLIENRKLYPDRCRAFRHDRGRRVPAVEGPEVTHIVSPLAPAFVSQGQISKDRPRCSSASTSRARPRTRTSTCRARSTRRPRAQQAHPGFVVEEFGIASATTALDKTLGKDFRSAERLAAPAHADHPAVRVRLARRGRAPGAARLLRRPRLDRPLGPGQPRLPRRPSDDPVVILLVGMAVGVDYSLFYLKREREERARAAWIRTPRCCARRRTSGQAVLISGATVLIAMAGMFLAGNRSSPRSALGTMLVVARRDHRLADVLPALLHRLGDRVDRGRIPFLRRRSLGGDSRVWGACSTACCGARGLGVVLSAGAARRAGDSGVRDAHEAPELHRPAARSADRARRYDRVQQAFPGSPTPAGDRGQGNDVNTPQMQQAVLDLPRARAGHRPDDPRRSTSGRTRRTRSRAIDDPDRRRRRQTSRRYAALQHAAQRSDPGHDRARVAGVEFAVTGETAGTDDFNDLMKHALPLVFAFVLGLAFLLLLMTFRSIVIPIKAIVLNLLSVGAAYGILVLVFQHGWAEGLLGFHSNGGDRLLAAAVPVRDPVRALDGLPRLHPQPDQGAASTAG